MRCRSGVVDIALIMTGGRTRRRNENSSVRNDHKFCFVFLPEGACARENERPITRPNLVLGDSSVMKSPDWATRHSSRRPFFCFVVLSFRFFCFVLSFVDTQLIPPGDDGGGLRLRRSHLGCAELVNDGVRIDDAEGSRRGKERWPCQPL